MILFLLLLLLLLVVYLSVRQRQMSLLARYGIPGPTPNLFTGNIFSIRAKANVPLFTEYFAKYGKIVGYYKGKKPNIIVNDIDLIRRIQIKDFSKFTDRNRHLLKYGLHPNPTYFTNLATARFTQWKELRTILNPTFSALKLKSMTPIIEGSVEIMLGKIEKKATTGGEFDIFEYFQLLTTDVIAKTALGIDTDVQNNPSDPFLQAAKHLFGTFPSLFLLAFTCFPELDTLFYPLRRCLQIIEELRGHSVQVTIARLISAAIRLRGNQAPSGQKKDLLQLMLDAKVSEEVLQATSTATLAADLTEEDATPQGQSEEHSGGRKVRSLSRGMIISTAIVFYEAGFETTSTTLAFIAHVLVTRPDIQEKVRQEVAQLYEDEGKLDYNTVSKLAYMHCVINETMRYYPPVTNFVTRIANEDYPYGEVIIPKDATVRIPTYQLHHSEQLWPNHTLFDPERFRDKAAIDPVAFQPFGTGPRNCIGMRFALYEIKLTLAKLLAKYRLVPGPKTETDLTIEYKPVTQAPKYGVFVKAVPLT